MELISKILFGGVITSGLFALTIWFITRYIKQRDQFEEDTNEKIDKIPEKIKDSVDSVKNTAENFRIQINELKSHNLDFQRKVQNDLTTITTQTSKIETSLERSSIKATEIENKLERVQFHEEVLNNVVKATRDLQKHAKETDNNFATVKQIISDNLILIRDKKKDNK